MKLAIGGLLAMSTLFAQDLLVKDAQGQWKQAGSMMVRAAKKMPAEKYDYKASDEVRTFGGFVGHVADAAVFFCAAAVGEKKAPPGAEKSMKTKEALVAALEESVAYCDKVYAGMTGAAALESVKFFGQDRTRAGVLFFNNMHVYEHYGNIVTYMRANGQVPPSSEGK